MISLLKLFYYVFFICKIKHKNDFQFELSKRFLIKKVDGKFTFTHTKTHTHINIYTYIYTYYTFITIYIFIHKNKNYKQVVDVHYFSNLRSLSIYQDKKLARSCLHYFKSIEKAVKYYKLNYSIPFIFQFYSVQLLLLE